MDSVLVDEWLALRDFIPIIDEASVSLIRERVRAEGNKLGLPDTVTASLVNVASELAHNQLLHARYGKVAVVAVERDGAPGLEIVAADEGDGIEDPTSAVRGRSSRDTAAIAGRSLGIGLSAVFELSDEVDVDVRLGEGTCIWARKFAGAVRRRRQLGIFGRAAPGETPSGDHATFIREEGSLLVAVADGLGHGQPARDASDPAMATIRVNASEPLDRILMQCHAALAQTRGAVIGLARFAEPSESVEIACVGNIAAQVYGMQAARRFSGPSFVVGARGTTPRIRVESPALDGRSVVVLASDGLSTRADVAGELDLLREHPIAIAHALIQRFARDNDDVLVAVVA